MYSTRDDLTGDNNFQQGTIATATVNTITPTTANKKIALDLFRWLDGGNGLSPYVATPCNQLCRDSAPMFDHAVNRCTFVAAAALNHGFVYLVTQIHTGYAFWVLFIHGDWPCDVVTVYQNVLQPWPHRHVWANRL